MTYGGQALAFRRMKNELSAVALTWLVKTVWIWVSFKVPINAPAALKAASLGAKRVIPLAALQMGNKTSVTVRD